jgi:hypothetical protein
MSAFRSVEVYDTASGMGGSFNVDIAIICPVIVANCPSGMAEPAREAGCRGTIGTDFVSKGSARSSPTNAPCPF